MQPNRKVKIAHLAGPTATIQNMPPLVTSNKARRKYGLPPRKLRDGTLERFDVLRAQRLAAPATVYVECFSAHPLEDDAAELYGPPDGYVDANGVFHKERTSPQDKAVFEIEIRPEDGLYPMPYMARQADGQPWEEECTEPNGPAAKARQGFFPDGSRSFEEIERLCIGMNGVGNLISSFADVDFYRVMPTGGYTKGLPAARRTDIGEGDIPPETRHRDFFAYKPYHLGKSPPRPALARMTNAVRRVLASGKYDGAVFTQGSPQVEESAYWFNLLVDTTRPISCNAAQRPHGEISNDGPKNITELGRVHRLAGLGRRRGTQPRRRRGTAGAAHLCRPRGYEGRRAARRLRRDRRPRRHSGRDGLSRRRGAALRAGAQAHI